MAIVSITDVLLELGISDDASAEETAIAVNTIKAAEGAVTNFIRYNPVYGSRTQILPLTSKTRHVVRQEWESYSNQAVLRNYGYGWTSELQVQGIPIRSITSLYLDYDGRNDTRTGAFGAETLRTEGTDYWANYDGTDSSGNKLCRDGILRSQGTWPETP